MKTTTRRIAITAVAGLLFTPAFAGEAPPPPDCTARPIVGDMNCDGRFDNFDIDVFVLALTFPEDYAAEFPGCNPLNGDADMNGRFDNFDIDPFVDLIVNQPRLFADAGGPYNMECTGGAIAVQLEGRCSHSIDGTILAYSWTTACPDATFDDPSSPTPVLTIPDAAGCEFSCEVSLMVSAAPLPPAGEAPPTPSVCNTSITISDTRPPQLTLPPNITVNCGKAADAEHTGTATAIDTCDPAPAVTFSDTPTGSGVVRTWTTTDACGNSTSNFQIITLVPDTTPPTLQCGGDITMRAMSSDGIPAADVAISASATDECDPSPLITDNRPAGLFPVGSTLVTVFARDVAGNATNCALLVNILPPDDGNSNSNDNSNGNSNTNGSGNTNDNGNTNGGSDNANGTGNGNDTGRPSPDVNGNDNQSGAAARNFQEEYIVTVTRTPLCAPLGMVSFGLMFVGAGLCRVFYRR